MRVHYDPSNCWLNEIPAPMRNRRAQERQQEVEAMGIVATGGGPGYLDLDISKARPEDVFAFMQTEGVVCCDVEGKDVAALMGKSPLSLGVKRAVESLGNLESLQPEEVMQSLSDIAGHVMNARDDEPINEDSAWIQGVLKDQTAQELRNAGFAVADAPNLDPAQDTRTDADWARIERSLDGNSGSDFLTGSNVWD